PRHDRSRRPLGRVVVRPPGARRGGRRGGLLRPGMAASPPPAPRARARDPLATVPRGRRGGRRRARVTARRRRGGVSPVGAHAPARAHRRPRRRLGSRRGARPAFAVLRPARPARPARTATLAPGRTLVPVAPGGRLRPVARGARSVAPAVPLRRGTPSSAPPP